MTPLLNVCYLCPSFTVIQRLIELGADVSVRDVVSQNSLFTSFSIQIFEEKTKCIASDCKKLIKCRHINY